MTAEVELIIRREREGEKLHDTNVELEDTNVELEAADAGQGPLPGQHEPRAAHAAERDPRVHGNDADGASRPANDEQAKQLRTVQANGRHLLSLINDLLDLARIESGKIEFNIEPIACRELLEEVAPGLGRSPRRRGSNGSDGSRGRSLELRTDRRALSQILINLTNNAIKFTDEGG